MAKINEKLQHDVEVAIDSYGDSNNLDLFKPFVGKISGMEPYGEPELGKAINEGDWETLRSLLFKLTNFDDSVPEEDDKTWDIDSKDAHEITDNTKLKDLKKRYLEDQIKNAEEAAKDTGKPGKKNFKPGLKQAKRDKLKWELEEKNLATAEDESYATKKADIADQAKEDYAKMKAEAAKNSQTTTTETTQETEGFSEKEDSMEISKKDLNKIMSAMRTINKHFAEEEEKVAEDQEVESQVAEDTSADNEEEDGSDESKQLTVVELPDDVADAIRDALDKATEVEADDDDDDEEDENFSEDDVEEEEEGEEDFCGDGEECFSDNEELMEFSEAITDTIENLNKKTNKLAAKLDEDATKFVTEFSMKEFKTFAESVTATLEAISSRVDALADKVSKNEITKNLDNLKKTGDDMEEKFITKADEKPVAAVVDSAVIQNPEATPAQFSESVSEDDSRRAAIKEFFSHQ